MPTVFFDIHRQTETMIDDEGVELPHTDAARALALELLGQAILDDARSANGSVTKIELRDSNGPFLRVSAAVLFEEL